MYGSGVENLLNQAAASAPNKETREGARMMKLKQLLDFDPFKPAELQRPKFADPAQVAANRVKKASKR